MPTAIDAAVLSDALTVLEGWSGDTDRISLTVTLTPDQDAALSEQVSVAADAMDHHPEVDHASAGTTYTLWTHSSGGVTELDVAMAARISGLVRQVQGRALDPLPAVGPAPDESDGPPMEQVLQDMRYAQTGGSRGNEINESAVGAGGFAPILAPPDDPFQPRPGMEDMAP